MRSRFKLLSLMVGATVVLLAIGGFLVVLGIFDDYLGWDIFSPEAEKLLYGVFGSCVALGGFGAAISIVLGLQEIVKALRRMIEAARPETVEPAREAPRRSYVALLATVLVLLIVTVGALNAVNRRVESHRLEVFKLIVRDQMEQLGPHMSGVLEPMPAPCATCAPPKLAELQKTLRGLSFCQSAVFYMADPADAAVLWRYPPDGTSHYNGTSSGDPAESPKIERLFVANDVDRAIKQALSGDTAWIDQMNADPAFNWHQVIRDRQGRTRAVLRILGNPSESYREYQAVAQAAKARGRK
jgi:hypothetical protein